ncbi:hypothetical protein [Gordonia iterans]
MRKVLCSTNAIEALGNQSIVDYLLTGGDPGEAAAFVDELQRWQAPTPEQAPIRDISPTSR